jgi:DNA-binding beta-propeller fold protein YncE
MQRRSLTPIASRMLLIAGIALSPVAAHADDGEGAFLPRLVVSSTVPANGDLNPYGVAFVPQGFPGGGLIEPGDVLISNFNNLNNLQGTGTTIVKLTPNGTVAPAGTATTFFSSKLAGLDTALGILEGGFVLVGNVPTTDGTINTISQGSLQVINRRGKLVQVLNDGVFLDSPWDLAINDNGDHAQVFVSNVLSGTVSRLDLAVGPSNVAVLHKTEIAVGYTHQPNAAALVLGPTGLAYDKTTDILYVASTADNTIFAVPKAGMAVSFVTKGTPIFAGPQLRGPLAVVFAPNGNLLTANGDAVNPDAAHPSEIVEFTKTGEFVREFNVDASQGGAFGIATALSGFAPFNFAAVDDVPNVVSVYSLP